MSLGKPPVKVVIEKLLGDPKQVHVLEAKMLGGIPMTCGCIMAKSWVAVDACWIRLCSGHTKKE